MRAPITPAGLHPGDVLVPPIPVSVPAIGFRRLRVAMLAVGTLAGTVVQGSAPTRIRPGKGGIRPAY